MKVRQARVDANSDLLVDRDVPGIVRITINRPHKHNALARTVLATLAETIRDADRDAATRVIIIRGCGDQYFAAGGDLVDLASVRGESATNAMVVEARGALDAIRDSAVPVIAYINGDALGGGAELAVACDHRMLEAHARIGFVQGRIGITSAWGGGTDLCNLVGSARAMRMMARCEMVGAEDALAWGLVDVVVSGGVDSEAFRSFVAPFLECSPLVLRGIKAQAMAWRAGLSFAERRAIEQKHLVSTWLSDEHWAAVDRFLERK
jgi:enoyl-CoA hydratase/carnithine racemase